MYYLFFFIIINLILLKVSNSSQSVKISIIIPVFNADQYLDRSISSALNQTLKEIEIICIDDASTDNSYEILKRFEEKDNRLKVLHLEENKGPSISRNTGINFAIGEYIGFMDSDDYVDERYFENLYKYSKGFDVVQGQFVQSIDNIQEFIQHEEFNSIRGFIYDSIFRRKFLDENNLRFPTQLRYMEDEVFRKECYNYHPKLFKVPDDGIYYYYIQRENSLCNYNKIYLKNLNKKLKKQKRNKRKETKKNSK